MVAAKNLLFISSVVYKFAGAVSGGGRCHVYYPNAPPTACGHTATVSDVSGTCGSTPDTACISTMDGIVWGHEGCNKCYRLTYQSDTIDDAIMCADGKCPAVNNEVFIKVVDGSYSDALHEMSQDAWSTLCPYACVGGEICVNDPSHCATGTYPVATSPQGVNYPGSCAVSLKPITSVEVPCVGGAPVQETTTLPPPPPQQTTTVPSEPTYIGTPVNPIATQPDATPVATPPAPVNPIATQPDATSVATPPAPVNPIATPPAPIATPPAPVNPILTPPSGLPVNPIQTLPAERPAVSIPTELMSARCHLFYPDLMATACGHVPTKEDTNGSCGDTPETACLTGLGLIMDHRSLCGTCFKLTYQRTTDELNAACVGACPGYTKTVYVKAVDTGSPGTNFGVSQDGFKKLCPFLCVGSDICVDDPSHCTYGAYADQDMVTYNYPGSCYAQSAAVTAEHVPCA